MNRNERFRHKAANPVRAHVSMLSADMLEAVVPLHFISTIVAFRSFQNFGSQVRRNAFIGINQKYPAAGSLRDCEVFLLRPVTIERAMKNPGIVLFCNFYRAIGTAVIHNDDFISKSTG